MSGPGESGLVAAVFGFVVVSLMLAVACAMLPFRRPVAAWFRDRLENDPLVPPLGRKSAAANSTPGRIALFAVAVMLTAPIMLWITGGKLSTALEGSPVSPGLVLLALGGGSGALVLGVVVLASARVRDRMGGRLLGVVTGVCLVAVGAGAILGGVIVALN
jgi:hypothetical protein